MVREEQESSAKIWEEEHIETYWWRFLYLKWEQQINEITLELFLSLY